MRKSFRGAVTLASLAILVGPATLLAQYPIVQQPPQVIYPPVWQPMPAVRQEQPVAQPQQTIAQPTQPPTQAPQPQVKQAPAPAKPAADDAITKAWLDKVIADRLKEAVAKQAEQAKVESEKVQVAEQQPAKPKVVEQSTRTMPAPPNVLALRYLADNSSFESSIEESKVEYQTNGIDLSKVPTTARITHGGEDLTVQQFGDELKAHFGNNHFADDKSKYWVGVFGPREFEEQVKRLLATDPSWQIIAEKCIVDFKSAAGNEKLAWRWKSIDCDRPQGILVCAPGYDRSSPDDACLAVHAQEDLNTFAEVVGSPPVVQDITSTDGASKYEGPNRQPKRDDKDSPLPFSRVRDARNAMRLVSWAWYALWASPGLLFLVLLFYAPVQTMRVLSAGFGWLVPSWMKRAKVDQSAMTPTITPVVQPRNAVCPGPTDDERDQVDRSQDARLNRLEEMITKLIDRPTVVEAQPIKRARKPAKR